MTERKLKNRDTVCGICMATFTSRSYGKLFNHSNKRMMQKVEQTLTEYIIVFVSTI